MIKKYISDHWHGRHSLARSFWVNRVILNICLFNLLNIIFIIIFGLNFEQVPLVVNGRSTSITLVLLVRTLFYMVIGPWQIMGILAAASNYKQKVWGTVATIVIFFEAIFLFMSVFFYVPILLFILLTIIFDLFKVVF